MSEAQATQTRLLPWHEDAFGRFMQLHDAGRLGHAWLLAGHAGTGKLQLGLHLARSLLCNAEAADRPCGQCSSCHLFMVGSHPDFRLVRPEKKLVAIEQIRDSIEFAQNTSQRGGMKVLLLEPAEGMNANAANALLKLLEEPPARTVLLLVSHQPGQLLATLRSRCQVLRCPLPGTAEALAWLQTHDRAGNCETALHKAGGAPLLALTWLDTDAAADNALLLASLQGILAGELQPLEAARRCEKLDLPLALDYLLRGIIELLRRLQAGVPLPDGEFAALAAQLDGRLDPGEAARRLHGMYNHLHAARKVALASNNANRLLLLETCLTHWRRLNRPERSRA